MGEGKRKKRQEGVGGVWVETIKCSWKTFLKDLNKWRNILCLWIERLNIVHTVDSTLEQHGFELRRSSCMWIFFNKYTKIYV